MEKNDAIELALCVRDSGAMPSIVMGLKYPNSISISGAGVSIVGGSDGGDSHSRIDHTFRGPSGGTGGGASAVLYGPRSPALF